MRTTIDLPDDLWKRVRQESIEQGVPANAFVRQALEAALPKPIRMTQDMLDTGLPAGIEEAIVEAATKPLPDFRQFGTRPARRPATAPGAVVPAGDPRANPAADTRQVRTVPADPVSISPTSFGASRAAPKPGGKRK